jgi:hypothetical protein
LTYDFLYNSSISNDGLPPLIIIQSTIAGKQYESDGSVSEKTYDVVGWLQSSYCLGIPCMVKGIDHPHEAHSDGNWRGLTGADGINCFLVRLIGGGTQVQTHASPSYISAKENDAGLFVICPIYLYWYLCFFSSFDLFFLKRFFLSFWGGWIRF